MSVHHSSHVGQSLRTRGRTVKEEEDANTLKLSRDFQSDAQAQALTLTEVAFVLESRKLGMMDSMGMGEKLHPLTLKTLDHCKKFEKIVGRGPISEAKRIFEFTTRPLQPFERTQLINLLPQTAEEAKNYIPSLRTHWADHDEDLQSLLDQLNQLASFRGDDN